MHGYTLLTGGLGYIGSHVAVEMSMERQPLIIIDNLANSSIEALEAIRSITLADVRFINGDVRNEALMIDIIKNFKVDRVFHFAGLKSVAESVRVPLDYYDHNFAGSLSLLRAIAKTDVRALVFSSSATVYGNPQYLPCDESHPTRPASPYGRSKLFIEEMIKDFSGAQSRCSVAVLRYFNPVGAHPSGSLGDNPVGVPNNLMPFLCGVAAGKLRELSIFGGDYDTRDGSGERDYIHVMDLATGHKAALSYIEKNKGFHVFNLGCGRGVTVFELLQSFEYSTGLVIPRRVVDRREGDVASCYADTSKATACLGWSPTRDIFEMCASAWNFASRSNAGSRVEQ